MTPTPQPAAELTIYYMRDNHTFRRLPLDVEGALQVMREERDAGHTYGMLCSKAKGLPPSVHASDKEHWPEFELKARYWLEKALAASTPPNPQALPELPPAIKWTLNGDKDCCYSNWLGETPFGRILITWKSWKNHHDACVDEFPGGFSAYGSPDEVKAACEAEFRARTALAQPPAEPVQAVPSTPSSHWKAEGGSDPHDNHYDCERATLMLGGLTDDELANGAFMNYDVRPSLQDIIARKPGVYMPIIWMTAVKERIRWLSRSLERALPTQPPSPQPVEGGALAMRVMQSDLYKQLDDLEYAQCNELIRRHLESLRPDSSPQPERAKGVEAPRKSRRIWGFDPAPVSGDSE